MNLGDKRCLNTAIVSSKPPSCIIRKTKRSEKIKRSVLPRKTKRTFLESPQRKNASDFSGAFRITCPSYFRHSNRTSHYHHHQAAILCALNCSRIYVHYQDSALCSSVANLSVVPSNIGGKYRRAVRDSHHYFAGRLKELTHHHLSGTVLS